MPFYVIIDGPSLRTGTQAPGLGFVALDMETIVQESGLGRRRCERAIQIFLAQGFIEVKKSQGGENVIKHSALRKANQPIILVFIFEYKGLYKFNPLAK